MYVIKLILLAITFVFSTQASANPREISCLASAIHYEARGEPLEGQKAVASVVMNRTRDKDFPETICKVIKQKGQFSFWPALLITAGPSYDLAAKLYKNAPNITNALYFRNYRVKWTPRSSQRIGNHIFYR